jgi:hypothetical protein
MYLGVPGRVGKGICGCSLTMPHDAQGPVSSENYEGVGFVVCAKLNTL